MTTEEDTKELALNKYRKIEVTPCILSGHNGIHLAIKSLETIEIYKRLNNTLLRDN